MADLNFESSGELVCNAILLHRIEQSKKEEVYQFVISFFFAYGVIIRLILMYRLALKSWTMSNIERYNQIRLHDHC